ncbi:hypothetical protein [Variovorax rhizosphaerae]|uniref:Transcriptional regulator n=1 Tax=Variovorax rhizosphaerae TaxID=1836200 RepID=A0ABU8WYY5_9BURK
MIECRESTAPRASQLSFELDDARRCVILMFDDTPGDSVLKSSLLEAQYEVRGGDYEVVDALHALAEDPKRSPCASPTGDEDIAEQMETLIFIVEPA